MTTQGRPTRALEPAKRLVQARVTDEEHEALRRIVELEKSTFSDVIRRAIQRYIGRKDGE